MQDGGVFAGLIKTFIDVGEIGGVDGLHADENPFAAGLGDEVDKFFVAQKIGADLRDPMDLRVGGDDVSQQRFRAFDIDGEIVVDEKDGDLTAFFFGAGFQEEKFVDDAFVGAEADGVTKETGDRAKFAAVRATAAGLHGNDAECAPTFTDAAEGFGGHLWNQIELIEIDFVPRNCGIVLEAGLALLAEGVDGRVKVLELAVCSVGDNSRPGFVGFAESNGVGMAGAATAAEGFVGFFGNVRAAHDDGNADGANRVRHAIGFGDHTSHGADTDETDFFVLDKLGDGFFVHGLRVTIDQHNFVTRWRERFEEKHPKVRHEIASNPIVRVIEQDPHAYISPFPTHCAVSRRELVDWPKGLLSRSREGRQ